MLAAALLVGSVALRAQNQGPQTEEQKEKQLMEYIDREVKRLSEQLTLEYWQEFYVDSTLTHDYHAMQEELEELQKAKVGNADIYQGVQDKWMQQIDDSYHRFFNEEQWKKYWKSTGQRRKPATSARPRRKKRRPSSKTGENSYLCGILDENEV